MKLMIASDIHGSLYFAEKLLEKYERWHFDRLVLLGDILYHGPRNDLPRGYAPKEVAKLLNGIASQIIAVRGNCDADIDTHVLDFPLTSELAIIFDGKTQLTLTHGHLYSPENPPKMPNGGVLLSGHTHVPGITKKAGFTAINPGSVSIPKNESECGYAIYDGARFTLCTLDGDELESISINA